MTRILRKRFSSAHYYRQDRWSQERNKSEFGKCFDPHGHGHDYLLEVEFQSPTPDQVHDALNEIIEKLDHHHLNHTEFVNQVPTTENLAVYLQVQLLKNCTKKRTSCQVLNLKLFENNEIWVEFSL